MAFSVDLFTAEAGFSAESVVRSIVNRDIFCSPERGGASEAAR